MGAIRRLGPDGATLPPMHTYYATHATMSRRDYHAKGVCRYRIYVLPRPDQIVGSGKLRWYDPTSDHAHGCPGYVTQRVTTEGVPQ